MLLLVATHARGATADDIVTARAMLDREEWAGALGAARDVLAVKPRDPQALYIAGVASLELGRLNDAERLLDKTLRVVPEAPEVNYKLGLVMLAMADDFFERHKTRIALGLCDEAHDHFQAELELSPRHEGALGGRAQALLRADRQDDAIDAYEAWIETVPESAEAHVALIRLYTDAGRADEAAALLEVMPRVEPEAEAEAVFLVARTLYQQDRSDRGRPLLERLQALPSAPWQVSGLQALDRLAAGERHEAAALLLEFLRSDPPDTEIGLVAGAYHVQYGAMIREAKESGLADGDDRIPKLAMRVSAEYPSDARRYGIEGEVLLLAIVEQDGSVGDLSVISATASRHRSLYEPQFEKAALTAVRQWLYEPARRDGEVTPFPITVNLNFSRP